MEQRVSLITLGVADLRRSRSYYEQLGWRGQEVEQTVFFEGGGQALVLWGRDKVAADAGIDDDRTCTFGGIVLAHNVRSREEVDHVVSTAANAGGEVRARPSTAATPVASEIQTATCGRWPTILASSS